MIDPKYKVQVDLLLQTIPYIARERIFALKGGTAINLFVRDMPRLSVDIDLTYVPLVDRETALMNISDGLARIKYDLEQSIPRLTVTATPREGKDAKINCQLPGAQIKIGVNTTTRGVIYPTRLMMVKDSVQQAFGRFAAIAVVSMAELYGGKICAALDRQHPRDLFDVKLLMDNEGITDEIKDGFLVALISHMRPISEVIRPIYIDQRPAFESQFSGMTNIPFTYEDYENSRVQLVEQIHAKLTNDDRFFLLSFKSGIPDWNRFPVKNAGDMPAVQWKLRNIEKLIQTNSKKHIQMLKVLENCLLRL